jgi:hypothetical protein
MRLVVICNNKIKFQLFWSFLQLYSNYWKLHHIGWMIFLIISYMNRLICLVSCISNQISCTLKLFYNDLGVYFNVCIKVIFTIYCNLNLKHYIWIWILLFQFWNSSFKPKIRYFNFLFIYIWIWNFLFEFIKKVFKFEKTYLNVKIDFQFWIFTFKFKKLIWFESWDLSFELLFVNLKINISIQNVINWV